MRDIPRCPFCGGKASRSLNFTFCQSCDAHAPNAVWKRRKDKDAGAKILAEFIGLLWEGITPDARPEGYPMWSYDGIGSKHYNGGLREIADRIAHAR